MKADKIGCFPIILLVLLFAIVVGSMIILSIEIESPLVINTTNTTIDLNETNRAIYESEARILKEIRNKNLNCGDFTFELPTDPINAIMQSVPNLREYELDTYDCTEFTENMKNQFQEAGFKARTKLTTVDCSSGVFEPCFQWKNNHAITEVTLYIESTTGNFIMPDDYELYGLK